MSIPKIWIAYIALALIALYWICALPFPDATRGVVNAVFFVLSLMTTLILTPDIFDIARHHGDGLSWQAVLAKLGLFDLTLSFSLARVWAMIVAAEGYPDSLVHSPVNGFFVFCMGLGLGGIFYGFGSVGELRPTLSLRGMVIVALVFGIVIGLVIRMPLAIFS